jgi:hypothetical protein
MFSPMKAVLVSEFKARCVGLLHGLTLITADRRILEYPHVGTIDARI